MKKHRVFSKVCIFFLILALTAALAACGSDNKNEATQTPTQRPDTGTNTPPPETGDILDEITAAHNFKMDLGGATLRYLCWPGFHFPTTPGQPEPNPEEVENYTNAMMQWEAKENMFKDFNIKEIVVTEVAQPDFMDVIITGMLANDPPGEWLRIQGVWVLDLIKNNIILPFNDFLPANHDLFNAQEFIYASSVFLDKVWSVRPTTPDESGFMLGVNLDILNALGLENPVDLYERHDGSWNYNKFLEMARIATKDTTGSGTIDQWGFSAYSGDFMRGLIGSSGVPTVNKYLKYNYDSPEIMSVLEIAHQLYAIDKSVKFNPDSGGSITDWDLIYAFKDGDVLFWAAEHWVIGVWNAWEDPSFKHTWVPYPLGPLNKDGLYNNKGFDVGYGVVRNSKVDPRGYFESYFAWNNWYNYDTELRDEANQDWLTTAFSTDKDWHRWQEWNRTPRRNDVGQSILLEGGGLYMDVESNFIKSFYNNSGTIASIIEAERPLRQSTLDQVLGHFRDMIDN